MEESQINYFQKSSPSRSNVKQSQGSNKKEDAPQGTNQ